MPRISFHACPESVWGFEINRQSSDVASWMIGEDQAVAGCVRTACSQLLTSLHNGCYQLVTRLMRIADLLQVCSNKLISSGRNKLLRACCHQAVNNLLRQTTTDLLGQTCSKSAILINLVTS